MQPHLLKSIRNAHRDRIDAAAIRDQRDAERGGMPYKLFAAGCWLVTKLVLNDGMSEGERYFATGPAQYRRFLQGLDDAARADVLEQGRVAIFDGRHPIYARLAMQVAA